MRWSRLVVVSALVAIVALSLAGLRVLSSPRVARAKPTLAPGLRSPRAPLELQLQLMLAGRLFIPPHGVPILPARPGIPYGGACYVALGRCSLTPCVEFAQETGPGVGASSSAVVLRLAAPLRRNAAPQLAGVACQGRLGMPKVLRVGGP